MGRLRWPAIFAGETTKRLLFFCLVAALMLGVFPPAGRAVLPDPAEKVGALLSYQIALKQEYLEQPSLAVAQALVASAGGHWDPRRQRILVYLRTSPDLGTLQRMQSLGIIPFPESYIPPVGIHPQGVMFADSPVEHVLKLAALDEVSRLETAEQIAWPSNDNAAAYTGARYVQDLGYTGAGVRIAVLDAGLDASHVDIPTPLAVKDYSDYPNLDDDVLNPASGHGTHVTATALGRGALSAGKYRGMAPEADLLFLKVGRDEEGAPARLDSLFMAIKAAVDTYGAEIVNMSYGTWDAYHDGTSALAQAVDYAAWRGVLVFSAAGNAADERRHASVVVNPPVAVQPLGLVVAGNARLALQVVWNDGKNRREQYTLSLLDASLNVIAQLEGRWSPESPHGTESLLVSGPSLAAGTYFIRIHSAAGSANGRRVHLYSQNDEITFSSPDPHYTIETPADAGGGIAVAAYVSRVYWTNYQGYMFGMSPSPGVVDEVASYSSRGPTLDERLKPDIAAPGTAIISARDRGYGLGGAWDPFIVDNDGTNDSLGPADYYVMGGTSMACPVAAGAAALLLEAFPALRKRTDMPVILGDALRDGAVTHRIPLQEGAGFVNLQNTYSLLRPYQEPSATPTQTSTPTSTLTPIPSATRSATRTPTATRTPVVSETPQPTLTSSATATVSATATRTPTTTATFLPGPTPSQTVTVPASPSPTPTAVDTSQPTATVTPTATPTSSPSPTIRPRAAAFLPLISRGKAYWVPTPTPSATAAPTTTPGIPQSFFDDFSDAGSGWLVTEQPSYSVGYAHGEYRVTVREYNWKIPSYAPYQAVLPETHVSVKARQAAGDAAAYGILFGNGEVHAFLVSPLGYAALWRYDGSAKSWVALRDWQAVSAVATGKSTNALAVEVVGGTARFYINDTEMSFSLDLTDANLGQMGTYGIIGVSFSYSPVDCLFDDFAVRLPSQVSWAD